MIIMIVLSPTVANGSFALFSAGIVGGAGFQCSKSTLGSLFSKGTCGASGGVDFSAAMYVGASVATKVEKESCCSSE